MLPSPIFDPSSNVTLLYRNWQGGGMEDSMRWSRAIAILALAAASGCGGSFAVGRPWDAAAEATVFDDGIDVVDDTTKLSGEWAFRAREDLDARSNLADMFAVVDITSVQTTKDIDGKEGRRIDARVDRILYGTAPDRVLVLEAAAASLGYSLITRHEGRLTGEYIVFLRWFELEDGTTGHHFHFSPSSPGVLEMVRKYVEARVAQEKASK
jgi:hypothetical protein